MSEPVWQWPESGGAPEQVGDLEIGRFCYLPSYLESGGAPLDPDELRLTRKLRGITITSGLREHIPGVIADAGPDSWGRQLLAQDLGYVPNALQALTASPIDGAGNLAVGDLDSKPLSPTLSLDDLADGIERRKDMLAQATPSTRQLTQILSPDTALGGAKPKAGILIDGTEWIAKFPERADPECLPFFEATALRVAALCRIESACVQVKSFAADRHVLLVKRFDRIPIANSQSGRLGFASALTVLGPQALKFSDQYSYLAFARDIVRWVGRPRHEAARAAIWQRLAYNALVGNTDDHARNHALIRENGEWRLAPAFDIVPTWRLAPQLSLSLPYFRNSDAALSSLVSARQLILGAPAFGITAPAAHTMFLQMANTLQQHWLSTLAELGAPSHAEPPMRATLAWITRLQQEAGAIQAAELTPPGKTRRGWGR